MGNLRRDDKNRQSRQELRLAHYAAQVLLVFMKPVVPMLLAALALCAASCKVGPNYTTPTAKVAGGWRESPAISNQAYSTAEEVLVA